MNKATWGGARLNAGRTRKNLRLDQETAIYLRLLANRRGKPAEQIIAELVETEWKRTEEAAKL